MFSAFANTFKIPELRQRILFTLGMILACRVVCLVPIPGVDADALRRVIQEAQQSAGGGFIGLFDLFSGGAI